VSVATFMPVKMNPELCVASRARLPVRITRDCRYEELYEGETVQVVFLLSRSLNGERNSLERDLFAVRACPSVISDHDCC
jgi:hypothetical protein